MITKNKMLLKDDIKSLLSKNKIICFVNITDADMFRKLNTSLFKSYFGEFKFADLKGEEIEVDNSTSSIYNALFTREIENKKNVKENSIYLFRRDGKLNKFFNCIYCDVWINGEFEGEHT